jgi:hypothetical protein
MSDVSNVSGQPQALTIEHTASLPFGYRATFRWSPASGLDVQWTPDVPVIRQTRRRRRFLAAYDAARNAFLAEIATTIGGNVLVLDSDGRQNMIPPVQNTEPLGGR